MGRDLQYALSTFGKTIPFAAADAFTLYFMTDIAGIAPALAGGLVMLMFCWAAVCDPIAGWIYERTITTPASARGYFTLGAVAMTAMFILSFALVLRGPWAWAPLLSVGLLFRLTYALVDVPHNALLAALQRGGSSPVRLGAFRLWATIAGAFVAILAAKFAIGSAPQAAPPRFLVMAFGVGLAGLVFFLGFFPFSALIEAGTRDTSEPPRPGGARWPAFLALAAFFLSAVVATLVNGMFSKDVVYIAKYVLLDPGWSVSGLALFTIGKAAGAPVWAPVAERLGPVRTMQIAFIVIAVAGLGVAAAPPNLASLGPGLFVFGVGVGGANITSWALMPTCAQMFAQRAAPLVFGAFTAMGKVASGLSGVIVGLTLTGLGHSPVRPSSEMNLKGLYWLIYVYPIVGALVGLAAIAAFAAFAALAATGRPPRAPGDWQVRPSPAQTCDG